MVIRLIASAFYHMELLQKINEMPLLTHANSKLQKRGLILPEPDILNEK